LGFCERLEVFTAENSKQRKKLDQCSQAKMESAPDGFLPGGVEQVLRSIVENSDDAIVTKNLDGIISSWNKSAERIFGYSAEEAIGKPVTILIPPERHAEETGILVRLRRGERIDHYETVRRRKDGTLIDVSLTVSPVKDAHGKIVQGHHGPKAQRRTYRYARPRGRASNQEYPGDGPGYRKSFAFRYARGS
jgi:PAS domain S-box-containing protein